MSKSSHLSIYRVNRVGYGISNEHGSFILQHATASAQSSEESGNVDSDYKIYFTSRSDKKRCGLC